MIKIPLDILSFNSQSFEDFCWSVSYAEYDFLSYGFVDEALKILELQSGDIKIALTCKLSDILIDIGHVARQALEIQSIKNAGYGVAYDADSSPTIDWLLNNDGKFISRNIDKSFKNNLSIYLRYIKRIVSKSVSPQEQGYQAMGFNSLMNERLDAENINTVNILVEFYMRGKPLQNEQACLEIASMLSEGLNKIYSFEYPVEIAVKAIIRHHIEQALGDIAFLKRSKLYKYLGQGLISGTPKYEGRMLGWYCQDNGKDVTRHAHGGERVFYKDYIWAIAELPYCSQYFAHSKVEANKIAGRIINDDYAIMPEMKNIEFKSRGSDKHKVIYQNAISTHKNKTLVYVTGVYLGDLAPNFPAFKLPDSLYFDFQIRLLNFLKDEGWRVIVKPHPKGLYNPAELLKPYADEVVTSSFDPNMFEAEVFLFDFAGTAFFDTLASKQRAVLLNLGNRPFDNNERKYLEKRCAVYSCGFDEQGRVELNKKAILQALDNAPDGEFNNFIKRYAS